MEISAEGLATMSALYEQAVEDLGDGADHTEVFRVLERK